MVAARGCFSCSATDRQLRKRWVLPTLLGMESDHSCASYHASRVPGPAAIPPWHQSLPVHAFCANSRSVNYVVTIARIRCKNPLILGLIHMSQPTGNPPLFVLEHP